MPETIVHGRYSILRTLGGGGMASVYLAHDEVLDREVALKVLRDQYAENEEFAERFKREARSAASLSHPNIVSVYDRGVTDDGTSYIAMEHVPGGSLKELISREGVLDADTAASIASQITEALEAAHGRGVIHRDIKPHNVLLTSAGDVKVADFGIARAAAQTSISHTSLVLGTASYMSPEQALGEEVDPRSDLYSVGVVLYEMLTGELPYAADNPIAASMKHVNEPLRSPKDVNPDVPESLNAVVTKLLAKKAGDRYTGATELLEDLRRAGDGLPLLAIPSVGVHTDAGTRPTRVQTRRTVAAPSAPARNRQRRNLAWGLAAILLLLALLGVLNWTLSQSTGVEVPSVTGVTQERAQQELETTGFRSEVEQSESSEENVGIVLDQSPGGGALAERGSLVTLQVGSVPPGPSTVTVPNVTNVSRAEAEAMLTEAGLAVGNVRPIPSNSAAAGIVIEQGYAAGSQVEPGSTVNLGVSSGPPPAPVQPDEEQRDLNEEIQDRVDEEIEEALENQRNGNGNGGEGNGGD